MLTVLSRLTMVSMFTALSMPTVVSMLTMLSMLTVLSVLTVSLLTLTLTLQPWTLHLSIWVAPYLSELSKIIEITKLEV